MALLIITIGMCGCTDTKELPGIPGNVDDEGNTTTSVTTLYVDGKQDTGYTSIQDAIDAADDGAIIHVSNGTYYENLKISKQISLIAENKTNTVINGLRADSTVISITADNVSICNFTLSNKKEGSVEQNDSFQFITAISITSNNTIICNNTVEQYCFGIYIQGDSHNNSIYENMFLRNTDSGIVLYSDTSHNTISKNTIQFGHSDGGINTAFTSENIICDNIITNNYRGITLTTLSVNNRIYNNTISNNSRIGLFLQYAAKYNLIYNNTIANNGLFQNGHGIYEHSSYFPDSEENIIYHNNFINNYQNAYGINNNSWDNGYPCGGNYWSDYSGVDADGDGLGDTAYEIEAFFGVIDRYPLIDPYPLPHSII